MEQAVAYLKSIKGVDMCSKAIGSHNVILWLFLTNIDEAQKIIESIKKQPYIFEVKTSIWTHVEKALVRPMNISLQNLVGANI